ncbi:hypothetical protein KYY02_23700 [Streptomyces pimonensis]|uniref:Uncharacterized protein n=1 Tax=Streptomyces pimonensis TaxID=2860288 RepID=A0ABV4J3T0_9ACTN
MPDVDGPAERPEDPGAGILRPPTGMFHGDRTAVPKDLSGRLWVFLTRPEDVQEELWRRRPAAAG